MVHQSIKYIVANTNAWSRLGFVCLKNHEQHQELLTVAKIVTPGSYRYTKKWAVIARQQLPGYAATTHNVQHRVIAFMRGGFP